MALTKIDDRGLKTPIDLLDNEYLRLGTDNDLELFHNGNHSFIQDVGTGNLYINSTNGNIHLRTSSNEQAVTCVQNAEVVLYHNNSRKLETTSYGALVTGTMSAGSGNFDVSDNGKFKAGNSSDLQIYHSGTDSIIDNTQGELQIATDAVMRFQATEYKFNNAANNEKIANFFQNGACELYFDHSKKLETGIGGEYGSFTATNGSNGWDGMAVGNSKFVFMGSDSQEAVGIWNDLDNEWMVKCVRNAETQLQYNGSKKLETSASGIALSGDLTFTGTSEEITLQTSDGSDDGYLNLSGGGACAQTRGAQLVLSGNERSGGLGGVLQLLAGNSGSTSVIQFYTSGSEVGRFDNNGRFAVGRTSPVTKVHIEDSSNLSLRLTKTGASDAEIKNTDSLDLCCSSGGSGGQVIRFLTGANPSSLVEHMRVNGSGHIQFHQSSTNIPGLGNTTVGACMEDVGAQGSALFVSRGDSISLFLNRNNTGEIVNFNSSGSKVGSISTNGSSLPSDRNFKKNITDLTLGLDFVNTLKPSKYNLKLEEDTDPLLFGLIAQDVEESLTAAGVTKNSTVLCQHNPTESETESDYNLDYGKFIPILINAIKELSTKVAALEAA